MRYIAILLMLFFIAENANAKKGCCSKHGGVCGDRCCDGTALSAKCSISFGSSKKPHHGATSKAKKKRMKHRSY